MNEAQEVKDFEQETQEKFMTKADSKGLIFRAFCIALFRHRYAWTRKMDYNLISRKTTERVLCRIPEYLSLMCDIGISDNDMSFHIIKNGDCIIKYIANGYFMKPNGDLIKIRTPLQLAA